MHLSIFHLHVVDTRLLNTFSHPLHGIGPREAQGTRYTIASMKMKIVVVFAEVEQ